MTLSWVCQESIHSLFTDEEGHRSEAALNHHITTFITPFMESLECTCWLFIPVMEAST